MHTFAAIAALCLLYAPIASWFGSVIGRWFKARSEPVIRAARDSIR